MTKKKIVVRILILAVILLVIGAIAKNRKAQTTGTPTNQLATANTTVPKKFQNTYNELEDRLTRFNEYLEANSNGKKSNITFAAELLPANGNRGEELLKENGYQGSVIYLDRLQSLGIEGITILMPYPILSPEFPRSSDYWNFYKKISQEIKRRGLTILVKIGPVFTDREFSSLNVDYSQTSVDDYFNQKKAIAQRIASEIKPHYLTIGNEPSTETMVLGKTGITNERIIRYINETLEDIDRSNTLIGAGSGTWEKTSYIENIASNTTLDYIDLHIYPVASKNTDYLMQAVEMADIAKKKNKKVIIGEVWLYKAAGDELTATPTHAEMFGRDTFNFWTPLDQQMLEVATKLAYHTGIEYISPFWSKYFFAYLDYESNNFRSPEALLRLADREAVKNLLGNKFTQTGLTYKELIEQSK